MGSKDPSQRYVLLMFEDYFRTSEKAGSLYRVEDLLGVVRTGEPVENLRRFLNRWDATIAGMETRQMIWFSGISYSDKSEDAN